MEGASSSGRKACRPRVRWRGSNRNRESEQPMATAIMQHEPLGLVVHDGGEPHAAPRIMMWFWASEDETPEAEKR
jgi:hypothetical protein